MGMMTESQRHSMAVWGSLLCFLCIGPSLALIAAGGYAKVEVESKIRLIEGFNTAALPGVIVFLGLYCVVHNTAAGTVLMSVRKPRMRERRSGLLLPGVVMGMILFLCLFLIAGVSLGQTMYLERSFDKGIVRAMRNYKSNRTLKAEIDNLQIDFKCCGNDRYTDWFKISWIREDYVNYNQRNRRTREGGYKNDDVPFSCCDAKSERPCINHHVHDNDMHYSYDYRSKTTLYSRGCRESLVNFYGKKLMTYVGLTLFGVSFFQFIVVLLTRYLQTSIAAALELGDPEAETMGYFFSNKESGEKGEDGKPLLDDDDEEEEEEGEGDDEAADEDEEPPEDEEEPEEYAEDEDMYGGWEGYGEAGGDDEEGEDEEEEWAPPPRRRNRNRSNIGQYLNNTNNYLGMPVENIRDKTQVGHFKREQRVIGGQGNLKLELDGEPRHPMRGNMSLFPRTDIRSQKRSSPRYLECLEFASSCKTESTTRHNPQDKCRSKIAKVNAWIHDIKENQESKESYHQPFLGSTMPPHQCDAPRLKYPVSEKKTADAVDLGFGHLDSLTKGGMNWTSGHDIGYESKRNKWECLQDFNQCRQKNSIVNKADQRISYRNFPNPDVRERHGFKNAEGQIYDNTISTNRNSNVQNDRAVRNIWASERNPTTNSGYNGNAHGGTEYDLRYPKNQRNYTPVLKDTGTRNTVASIQGTDKRPLQNNLRPRNDIYLQRNDQGLKYDTSIQHFRRDLVLSLNSDDDRRNEWPSDNKTFPRN